AGGSGSRLYPITLGVSKHLIPIYDKPMIYYPLSVLMLAGIREILIITTAQDLDQYQRLLKDGSQWGIELSFTVQAKPEGLAQAFILGEDFLDGAPSMLILGDNIFFGIGFKDMLMKADLNNSGATILGYHVADPRRYGVVGFDKSGKVNTLAEKPLVPDSNFAVTGLYIVDERASDLAKTIKPSSRGELEIISLLEIYLNEGSLRVEKIGRGCAWLDTGTHSSLIDAGNFVRTIQERQGLQVANLEEIAYNQCWIDDKKLSQQAEIYKNTDYGSYLQSLLKTYD
ncbi:MAG: glucose-1-phosphate thymidylyltransferase RfbA, partial [Proteobacteria bacterium]|nr:glucose-1-phosphate thymidylyltransferase RfbA [Pseudomonadota bacterium]